MFHQALALARQNADKSIVVAALTKWCEDEGEVDMTPEEISLVVTNAFEYAAKKPAATIAEFEMSDVGNALQLLKVFGEDLVYAPGIGWHTWSGAHWRNDVEELGIKQLAIRTMDDLKDSVIEAMKSVSDRGEMQMLIKLLGWARSSHNAGRIDAMTKLARSYDSVLKDVSELDSTKTDMMLNFKNGTLDLITGVLRPHNKEDLITRVIKYDYNPNATCPTWLQTLELAFNGDKEMIEFFHRAVGYIISGSTSEQCFFIAYGESGANGKSTILEALQHVMGETYATMSDARVIASRDKDNHVLSSLAALNNMRLVSINEMSEDAVLDEELIKQLTGGDTLQAKRLYMEPFTFRPKFKIVLRANNKPVVRGSGNAFWRRVKLIPFEKPIPVEVRKPRHVIDAMLVAESEGILAWAVEGFKKWYAMGLQEPQKMQNAAAEYRDESDIVTQFFADCVEQVPGSTIPRATLYSIFVEWCRAGGIRYVMTADKFGKRVTKKYGLTGRVRERGIPVWQDMRLTPLAHNYSL